MANVHCFSIHFKTILKIDLSMRNIIVSGLLILLSTILHAQNPFAHGNKIALQADNGFWLEECYRECATVKGTSNAFMPTLKKVERRGGQRFEVIDVGNGKIALRDDYRNYLATCSNCVEDSKVSRSLIISGHKYTDREVQFKPIKLANGKYALQTSDGYYVARCSQCITNREPQILTAHVTSSRPVFAQFNVVVHYRDFGTDYATIKVENKSVQRNWFKVLYSGYDGFETKEVYVEAGQSKTINLNRGYTSVLSVEGQALDVTTWKSIFTEKNFQLGSGASKCFSINSKLFSPITGGVCK